MKVRRKKLVVLMAVMLVITIVGRGIEFLTSSSGFVDNLMLSIAKLAMPTVGTTQNLDASSEIVPESISELSPSRADSDWNTDSLFHFDDNNEELPYSDDGFYPKIIFPEQQEEIVLPEIPSQYKRYREESDMGISTSAIKNLSNFSLSTLEEIIGSAKEIELEYSKQPEILIFHTHATEAFNPYDDGSYDNRYNWRSTDNLTNIVSVGAVMAETLESYGISVLHDTTHHDYPSYNGSYENSAKTVSDYLDEYPSIKLVIDIHRDAFETDNGTIVAPLAELDSEKHAQIMIISCVPLSLEDNSSIPDYDIKLKLAHDLTITGEELYPGLMRPVSVMHNRYNQHLLDGAILIEIGTHGVTLDEAKRSAEKFAEIIMANNG